MNKPREKDELAKMKAEENAGKAGSRQNRMKRKTFIDQQTSQNDMTTVLVSLTTASNTDDTTQDALELDYECCECLGTYQDDVKMGNGAEWIKCACGQWLHEECVESTATDVNGKLRCCSNCIV